MSDITTKKVLKYVLLPGILPRMHDLFSSGFGHLSFFIAHILHTARLLPAGHPYLNTQNMGRFGIRHVMAQAANNLEFKTKNTDQILIFALILTGIIILLSQFAILATAIFIAAAEAATMPSNFAGFFGTEKPMHDIAFVLMDRVFGIPGLFGSCIDTGDICFQIEEASQAGKGATREHMMNPNGVAEALLPWPYHSALHSMLQLYSTGLLVIAMLILAYFVITVLVETAQTGTPFGQRFNHVWAPIRLVVALGLLIPLGTGLNSGQYIALYAAKWGSGFATNGWKIFVDTAKSSGDQALAGPSDDLIAVPKAPALTNLLEFSLVLQTCMYAEEAQYPSTDPDKKIQGYIIRDSRDPTARMKIKGVNYETARTFTHNEDILVRFGRTGTDKPYNKQPGLVTNDCGEVILTVGDITQPSVNYIQSQYWELIKTISKDTSAPSGCSIDPEAWPFCSTPSWGAHIARHKLSNPAIPDLGDDIKIAPTSVHLQTMIKDYEGKLHDILIEAKQKQIKNGNWTFYFEALGWGGAALWYNKIAQLNGAFIAATGNVPRVKSYPRAMREVRLARSAEDNFMNGRKAFNPSLSDGKLILKDDAKKHPIADAEWYAFNQWTDQYEPVTGNIFIDLIKGLIGIQGLFDMQENNNVHPLAQLAAIGKSLTDSSIRNFALSLGTGIGGGLAMIFEAHGIGNGLSVASNMFFSIGLMGMGVGFILFYILPILPFLYFFFAVGGWIKGLFEAMVGVPLWALAHIRIDGNSLPADTAMGGYYLILDIFLRPILIVFGLVASIVIFSAQVSVLNEIWSLVTSNVGGFDEVAATATVRDPATGALAPKVEASDTGGINFRRDYVDEFFYTVIYAIVVYMLAMASFKLVDQIPNYLLRWLNAQVKTFGEQNQDVAANLVQNTFMAEQMMSGSFKEIQQQTIGGISQGGQSLKGLIMRGTTGNPGKTP